MEYTKEQLLDFEIIQNLASLGGDDGNAFLKEIIELYINQYPSIYSDIKASAITYDSVKLSQTAHALKGASLNIGAREVADICKKLEFKGKENDMDGVLALVMDLDNINSQTMKLYHQLYF